MAFRSDVKWHGVLALAPVVLIGCSTSGRIEGRVTWQPTGKPIPGARVTYLHLGTTEKSSGDPYSNTDSEGAFQFAELAPGDYLITASMQAEDGRTKCEVSNFNDLAKVTRGNVTKKNISLPCK